ncbi:golgin subfamily A member 4 [Diretmus argenteus]
MFKKLKQKINEEQSPQRNAQSPQQAQVGSGDRRSSHTPSIHQDGTPSPSDREMLAGMIAEPAFLSEYTIFALDHSKRPKTAQVASVSASKGVPRSPRGSINGDGSASPQREVPQSFAQKLQLKVPSVESLLRGSASRAENLFRSPSKESLVRSPSRDSLTPLGESESLAAPAYDPPSDIESEAEDSPGNAESLSKEQLLHSLHRLERSLGNYRGKYSELVTAYRTAQRDKEKSQAILSQSQDKALRRIGELREELQMDQQAKKHLQDEFDAALEEKDQMVTVLQTQVALLKKRCKGFSGGAVPPEGEVPQSEDAVDSASAPQSPSKEAEAGVTEEEGNSDPAKVMEALQKRVKRQENLLQKCKDLLRVHKERSTQLGSENETLQEQLQERLQEVEKMKELHMTEKSKLITQLRDAKNLIEQLEQDKGMVIAETKRQMHETLEMKEEEIARLRSRLQQATARREELQEQKEKSEKSAFEELERALGQAQRAEESQKQLQVQLEEQVKEVERASEEERRSLQQELRRVKQEVVTIMKKSSEETVANMERLHNEALAAKEEELSARISHAVEQCKEQFAQNAKEREQQADLALEDVELQKTAQKAEAENKVKDLQLELEATKTRILELESSLERSSQNGSVLSHEFSSQIEELRVKHKEQMSALEEKHQEQLEKHNGTLTQQHNTALEELKEKHRVEMETILKDKELEFQAHVEDMNQKTLEKLDVKQTDLEALSFELSEALKSKQLLEEKLMAIENADSSSQRALEQRLQDQVAKHNAEIVNIKQEYEQSLGGMEKTLKEGLNKLKTVLKEKERELKEHVLKQKTQKEELVSVLQELSIKVKELEQLHQSLSQLQSEKESLKESNAQLSKITDDLVLCKSDLKDLKHQLEVAKSDCKHKEESLQQRLVELQDLEQQLQQTKKELSEQEKSHSEELNAKQEEEKRLKKQLDEQTVAHDKKIKNTIKEMEGRLKAQETKMDKVKQKAKEMQEKFKKRLQENEESMKKELEKKETELQQKEQQVQEKFLQMAQRSSQGLSSAMSELQANHKEKLEKLHYAHKHELEELEHRWQQKLAQQEEDLREKHSYILQEKSQELEDISQQLIRSREETEQVFREIKDLKEDLAIRETTVQKQQAELKEAAVKLESLSQGEILLKEQIDSMERNLNQALNERNSLQDQLSTSEEENRDRFKALSAKFEETEMQLKALEASQCKEGEDFQRKLEESAIQLEARKEAEYQKHLILLSNQMEHYCKEVQSKVECGTNELCERVEYRVRELKDRVLCNQKKVGHLKNIILTKVDRICTLDENLRQQTEENRNLCSSLEQMTAQVNTLTEHIEALTNEKERLQRDVENHSQSVSEKVLRIEELSEENKAISESVKTKELHISKLEGIINDLKTQLAGSVTEIEETITMWNQQYKEKQQQVVVQMEETIERLEQEKKSAVEQADTLRNSLCEFENKAESKFIQSHNTVTSLQTRLDDLEREISEKNEALQRLEANTDNQSISKSEMGQALREKEQRLSALTVELESCNSRLCDLQQQFALKTSECEQLTADLKQQHSIRENERREFTEQQQQTQVQFTQNGNLHQETVEKLHSLEKENQTSKLELERQREEFEKMKIEILKSKEESLKATEERLSKESAKKVLELKKKAEQKIGQIKKQLTSQLEEKDQTIKALQTNVEEIKRIEASNKQLVEKLEEKGRTLKEALLKREEQEKQLKQTENNERLEKEKSLEELKNMYEEKLSSLQRDEVHQEEAKADAADSMLQEVKAMLEEAETQNGNLLAEISCLKEELLEKNALLDQHQATAPCSDKQGQNPLELEDGGKVEHSAGEQTKMENDSLQEVDNDSLESIKKKLAEVKNEKQKIQKDFTRLQKDIRSLRKEHEQDLEFMKKELAEENEKRLKLELEDMEMKHNSALKHLLREFNTQMALKENELDTAVKDTIEKAQSVEAELIGCHREEAGQLQKVIAQKEDDLHRTVQKYEQVLQSREEEMGARVWQVQKELEELQARSRDNSEMGVDELQAQLAEKTTLLSEARLKEQGFVDRIHSLEDKIRCFHKKSVVTHLGSSFKDPGYNSADALSEPTEFEYLRKVLFEYMMGRETKTMAKVITSMLKFPPDQVQKVLDKEDSKATPWIR